MSIFVKSEYNILKLIYENHGIRLSEIMKRARVSAGTLKNRINELLDRDIITEKKILGGEKVLLKSFYPNLDSEEGKTSFALIELEKKREFFKRNNRLIGPFKQFIANSNVKIIIVFGSFANNSQTKDSDLDILLLDNKKIDKEALKKEIERAFVTFDYVISPRFDTIMNFKKNKGEAVYQSITKNHIIIKGAFEFVGLDLF